MNRGLGDAARIVSHRDAFRDLEAALLTIGFGLDGREPRQAATLFAVVEDVESYDDDPVVDDVTARRVDASAGWSGHEGGDGGDGGSGREPGSKPAGRTRAIVADRRVMAAIIESRRAEIPEDAPGIPYRSVPVQTIEPAATAPAPARGLRRTLASELHSATKIERRSTAIDVGRAIQLIARARVLDRTVLLSRRAPAGSVRVLHDRRLRIGPFAQDAAEVAAVVHRMFGLERSEDLGISVETHDVLVGSGPVWTWRRYEHLRPAPSVLVVTGGGETLERDSSLGGFCRRLQRRGVTVAVVVIGAGQRLGQHPFEVIHLDD